MNAVYLEALIYAVQIVSFIFVAGPVMVKIERSRTLALNPPWIASQPAFLQAYGEVDMRPFRAATLALLSLLGAAAVTTSRLGVFAVHTPLFLMVVVGFYVYYDKLEKRLRAMIPEDPIRKATLSPRRLGAFLPKWVLWALAGAVGAILGINAWGYATGFIEPSRALANGTLLSLLAVGLGLLIRHTLRRPSYRLSPETDSAGRSLELSLTLGIATLFVIVCLYHTVGSLGASPLFAHPPTQLHALIEGTPWNWTLYFERTEYRWGELGVSLFIALIGPWLARSSFTRRLIAADPGKLRNAFEV